VARGNNHHGAFVRAVFWEDPQPRGFAHSLVGDALWMMVSPT
jgi:hypothetical protein